MKLNESTLAVYGAANLNDAQAEKLAELLAECVEAAALDLIARFHDDAPDLLKLGAYVTVDGERVEPAPTDCTRGVVYDWPTLTPSAYWPRCATCNALPDKLPMVDDWTCQACGCPGGVRDESF